MSIEDLIREIRADQANTCRSASEQVAVLSDDLDRLIELIYVFLRHLMRTLNESSQVPKLVVLPSLYPPES